MSNDFAAPASASGIAWEELNGALLLFEPVAQEHDVPTTFGPKDPVRGDVTVLDGTKVGEVYNDALVFPLVLVGQLKSRIGQMVLGRLEQGVAKPGQKPPWKLSDPTPADIQVGSAWVNRRNASAFVTPSTPLKGDDSAPF